MLKENIISEVERIYGDAYETDMIENNGMSDYVTLKCKKHALIFRKRLSRLLKGSGCPLCSGKARKTFEQFVEDARKVHGDKYEYNDGNYVNSRTKIGITCPEHGTFYQTPTNHLNGNGCPKCKAEKSRQMFSSTMEKFIEKADEIHNGKYDYSKVEYINRNTPVIITCEKHGDFTILPTNFYNGVGCPVCAESNLEGEMRRFLEESKINYEPFKKFDWLGKQHLDFYLTDYNVAIECQGGQHFKPVDKFGGEETFAKTVELDMKKRKLCKENGIKLFYYANYRYNFPYKVFMKKDKLLEEIKKVKVN